MCEVVANRPLLAQSSTMRVDPVTEPELQVQNSVARVLLAAYKDERLTYNGRPLSVNDAVNVRDKHVVSQFNFKEAIKKYYIHYIQLRALQAGCKRFVRVRGIQ